MPLLWVFSNCVLLVILVVVIGLFSMEYFNLTIDYSSSMGRDFLNWWW